MPNQAELRALAELFLDKATETVIISVFVILAGLFLKQLATSIFLYVKARFSELGVGAMIILNKEIYSIDRLYFSFVELRNLQQSGVVLRIPLARWDSMDKMIKYQKVKFEEPVT